MGGVGAGVSGVNNFDVLKRMAAENKSIQLCTTVTQMNYSAKKGGTEVSVGVPGNVCFDIQSGRMNCLLLLFSMQEFNELKAKIEQEQKAVLDATNMTRPGDEPLA